MPFRQCLGSFQTRGRSQGRTIFFLVEKITGKTGEGFGEHSSIPDTDSWNKSKYAFSCLAVLSGVSTGAMIFWDGYLKSKWDNYCCPKNENYSKGDQELIYPKDFNI